MRTALSALCLLTASLAAAQGQVLIRVQQGNNISQIANGGTVTVNATGLSQAKTFSVTVTYTGSNSLTFTQAPQLLGSPDFTISRPPNSGAALAPNQSLTFELTYLPTSTEQALAELDYPFVETSASSSSTASGTPGLVVIGLNGLTPEYSLYYSLSLDSNITPLPRSGVLSFTDTPVNTATIASMAVVNLGSGSGRLLSVSTTGDAFSLTALPLLPAVLSTSGSFQFQVRYRPRQVGTDSGTLTITLEGGATYSVSLRGSGVASYLSYTLLPPDGGSSSITPGQAISLPAAPINGKSSVYIRMQNNSGLDITVANIAVTGSAFQLSGLPFVPLVMPPGDAQTFTLTFAPTTSGAQTGRLLIGGDTFDLTATPEGSQFSYSYTGASGTLQLPSSGTVVFPNLQVGKDSTTVLTVRNDGASAASLSSVAILSSATGRPIFTLSGLPSLPATIQPHETLSFTIRFAPLNTTLATATLRLDGDSFTLSGAGTQPDPLPSFSFQGPSSIQPFQQPTIGLTLASAYSVDLTGTLTLSTVSDVATGDPSVQFISGGRVATFTIPAGSTTAVFSGGSSQLRFQTGSVAGTLIITPSFATEGGLDLTPDNPTLFQVSLPAAAPQILDIAIGSRSTGAFTILVTGNTTTRSLSRITVTFKGKSGYNFPNTEFAQDLTTKSYTWFSSEASQSFGGQFTIQVPFTLTSSDTSSGAMDPVLALESATVTITNSTGSSSSVTVPIS